MKKFDEDRLAQSAGARHAAAAPLPFVTASPDGKKFSTLLPTDRVCEILLEHIVPDPNQPRKEFAEDAITDMANSLKHDGQLQPIVVRWKADLEKWLIVAGERRYRGAIMAGLSSLLCVIEEDGLTQPDILIKQLIENCLRTDLKPIEQAVAFKTLMDANAWTGKQLAERLNIAASAVTQALALLDLPADVQEKVTAGELPASVAYEVTKLDDPEQQREVVEQVVEGKMSRSDARRAVRTKRRPAHPTSRRSAESKERVLKTSAATIIVKARRNLTDEHMVQVLTEALGQFKVSDAAA